MQAQVNMHTPPWEPVQQATAKVLRYRNNFPGRTHSVPQAVAMSHRSLASQACPAFRPPPPPGLRKQETLISHCFNPFLSRQGTDALGGPTHRGRAKTKAEPQELCKQRRERKTSLCSLRTSRLNPHNQLDEHCICGISK